MHFADPDSGQPDLIPEHDPARGQYDLGVDGFDGPYRTEYSPHLEINPDHPIENAVLGVTMNPGEVFTYERDGEYTTYRYSLRHTHTPPTSTELPEWLYKSATLIRQVVMTVPKGTSPGSVLGESRRIAKDN